MYDSRQQYTEMSQNLYEKVHKNAWSIENREAHEALERDKWYIGSKVMPSGLVYDYYQDSAGDYWFKNRWQQSNGEIVSMELHIFGCAAQRNCKQKLR